MTGHDSIHLGSGAIVDVTLPDQEVARDLLLDDDLLQAKLQTEHHHVLHLCHDSLQIDKSYCKKRESDCLAEIREVVVQLLANLQFYFRREEHQVGVHHYLIICKVHVI